MSDDFPCTCFEPADAVDPDCPDHGRSRSDEVLSLRALGTVSGILRGDDLFDRVSEPLQRGDYMRAVQLIATTDRSEKRQRARAYLLGVHDGFRRDPPARVVEAEAERDAAIKRVDTVMGTCTVEINRRHKAEDERDEAFLHEADVKRERDVALEAKAAWRLRADTLRRDLSVANAACARAIAARVTAEREQESVAVQVSAARDKEALKLEPWLHLAVQHGCGSGVDDATTLAQFSQRLDGYRQDIRRMFAALEQVRHAALRGAYPTAK